MKRFILVITLGMFLIPSLSWAAQKNYNFISGGKQVQASWNSYTHHPQGAVYRGKKGAITSEVGGSIGFKINGQVRRPTAPEAKEMLKTPGLPEHVKSTLGWMSRGIK
jgi:hypothetical protein